MPQGRYFEEMNCTSVCCTVLILTMDRRARKKYGGLEGGKVNNAEAASGIGRESLLEDEDQTEGEDDENSDEDEDEDEDEGFDEDEDEAVDRNE